MMNATLSAEIKSIICLRVGPCFEELRSVQFSRKVIAYDSADQGSSRFAKHDDSG
jgi:hypothetical protein